ncbi:MAG: hypothetical protein P8Y24_10305 [Gammaproteobacteria bacterium]
MMKIIIITITLLYSTFVEASCGTSGCKTIKEFTDSYVKALLNEDKNELQKHFLSKKHTCYLDRFDFDGVYTGHHISDEKVLKGESLEHFLLTYQSEATKIKLFNRFRKNNPDLSDSEISELVIKELQNPELKRVKLAIDTMPTHEVRLDINGKSYQEGHPCFTYTGTSNLLYLVNTKSGYQAVEPMCDVGRTVGKQRINKDDYSDKLELSTSQINEIKKYITEQKRFSRLHIRLFIMEKYGYNNHKAKYAVKQVCEKF